MAIRVAAALVTFGSAISLSDSAVSAGGPAAVLQISKQAFLGTSAEREQAGGVSYAHPSWLPSCRRIFLDVGSNRGVQVRKFFEPQKYPKAPLLDQFDEVFGAPLTRTAPSETTGLCVLGLEPNPEHGERLEALQEAYTSRGWHVHFYPFAAWNAEGHMGFNKTSVRGNKEDGVVFSGGHLGFDKREMEAVDAGGSIDDYLVRTIDLAEFVSTLPVGVVVELMKMDIEGAEYETLSSMLKAGLLCGSHIRKALIECHAWGKVNEWAAKGGHALAPLPAPMHPRSFQAIQVRLRSLNKTGECAGPVMAISELDDETFLKDVDNDFADSVAGQ